MILLLLLISISIQAISFPPDFESISPPESNIPSTTRKLMSLPVHRKAFHARTSVDASFASESQASMVIANLTLEMGRPTIRLANFPQIISVKCVQNSLELLFDNTKHATVAFREWSNTPDLVLLIPHESACYADEIAVVAPTRMFINANKLQMRIERLESGVQIKNWVMNLKRYESKKLEKRGLARNLTWSYDSRFGKNATNRFFNPEIFLGESYVKCLECWSRGTLALEIDMKGTFFNIISYKVVFRGDIKANMDVNFITIPLLSWYLHWVSLYDYSKIKIDIPGLFKLGPSFKIYGVLGYETDIDSTMTLGFDLHVPMNIEISSNKNITGRPEFVQHEAPRIRPHALLPLMTSPKQIGLFMFLQPNFSFTFEAAGRTLFEMALDFRSILGVELSPANKKKCPTGIVNMNMFVKQKINFKLFPPAQRQMLRWNLWQTPRESVPCLQCNLCSNNLGEMASAT